MRAEIANACEEEKVAYETSCNGKVQLTQQHLDSAYGDDDATRRSDILDEARIGCCQKCGCLSATAEFRIEKNAAGQDVEYVFARCNQSPSALALGHRVEPEPDVRSVHHLDPAAQAPRAVLVDRPLVAAPVQSVPEGPHPDVRRPHGMIQP